MREILFRGKRIDNGEWVEGYYFYKRNKYAGDKEYAFEYAVITPGIEITRGAYGETSILIEWEVIPETVSEFTSLYDKNGKKIFEGDIVNATADVGYLITRVGVIKVKDFGYVVETQNSWWGSFRLGEKCEMIGHGYSASSEYEYEVIGNIHDNPELLEEGAE